MASVKAITQDTFDSVVKENINDFEMDNDEAVQDAIKQFESQVCTNCILTDVNLASFLPLF